MALRSRSTPGHYEARKGLQPCISSKDSKFATLLVGAEAEKFTLHEELLTFQSPYFRGALTGGFKEAEDKTVRSREEGSSIVEVFVHWLYYQRLPNEDDVDELCDMWNGVPGNGSVKTANLIHIYVFCDKFDVPELKIMTMTELFNQVDFVDDSADPTADLVEYAYDNLPDDSPLCRFLVDWHCHWATEDSWTDFAVVYWPLAFITKVLCQYTEFAHGDRSRDDNMAPCDYHEHQTGEDRAVCQRKQLEEQEDELL